MPALTRRALAQSAAVGAGAVAVTGAIGGSAEATYTPRPYLATKVPDEATRHALSRFTYGWTPALLAQVTAAGGFNQWFDRQVSGFYSDNATSLAGWWPSLNLAPLVLWAQVKLDTISLFDADVAYQRWCLARQIRSERQVLEVMTEFWEHHLNVPALGETGPFRADYGRTVRSLALGRFDEILPALVTHPAMAVYLSNANSSKQAPNENLGRELLELHTVGRGNFTEDDVKNSARILTGYTMGAWTTWVFGYDPSRHWTGAVKVLGFSHPNAQPDGRACLNAYLKYLAHHPLTAQRIARKLAVRFVSDNPSSALVDQLANVYLANQTAIVPVLKAIIASAEFKASAGQKVRTPSEDIVATYRALGATLGAPATPSDDSAANAIAWQVHDLGNPLYGWPRPDGRPDHGAAWSSTSRFLASLERHYSMAGRWWPDTRITYRTPASWLPPPPRTVRYVWRWKWVRVNGRRRRRRYRVRIVTTAPYVRFDEFVDHLSRSILGRGSTSLLLQTACQATGCAPADGVTSTNPLMDWKLPRLLTVFLDSPYHMTR